MFCIGFVCWLGELCFITTRLLTTMLTLILTSKYVVQNHTGHDHSLTVSGGSSIVVIMTLNLETRMPTLLPLDIL